MPGDHSPAAVASGPARVAVVIPCHGEGALVAEAVHSIQEDDPVEIVVVDNVRLEIRARRA
jgi:hypothetical protein